MGKCSRNHETFTKWVPRSVTYALEGVRGRECPGAGLAPALHACRILPYDNFGHRSTQPFAVKMSQIEWVILIGAICSRRKRVHHAEGCP
jgi:hypothetical protein